LRLGHERAITTVRHVSRGSNASRDPEAGRLCRSPSSCTDAPGETIVAPRARHARFCEAREPLPILIAWLRDVTAAMTESVDRAFAAGVKVAFGTEAAAYPHGLNAREFRVYVKPGMTPLQANQTATLNAADLLGSDRVGSLEPGRFADMIAVNGDPTGDVTVPDHVAFVMKGGVVYTTESSRQRTAASSERARAAELREDVGVVGLEPVAEARAQQRHVGRP
jgi:hypothetical protein